MDFINEMILKELKEDSRISMSELGRRVHLSAPAVRERIRQLEEQNVIKRYTLDINKKHWVIQLRLLLKRQSKITAMQTLKNI